MTLAFFQQFADNLDQGSFQDAVVLATVVEIAGSVPREVGAKLLVNAQGESWGTIGGGAGEAKVIRQAREVMQTGQPELVEIDLSGNPLRDTQGVCGGKMRVWLARWQGEEAIALIQTILTTLQAGKSLTLVTPYDAAAIPYVLEKVLESVPENSSLSGAPRPSNSFEKRLGNYSKNSLENHFENHLKNSFIETLQPAPTLLIIGAGHCGIQLAKVAHLLDFQVMVQDDRTDWANPTHYPMADRIFTDSVDAAIATLTHHPQLYVALLTRGFQYDVQALTALVKRPLACTYIGMIGSQKRVRQVLAAMDSPPIPTLHAPIGLNIGALTPAEIAVSIAAQLVMVRRGKTRINFGDTL